MNSRLKRGIQVLVIGILIVLGIYYGISECQKEELYSVTYTDVFDTVTSISGYGSSESEFEERIQPIHDKLLYYNKLFDIYKDYEGLNNLKTINDNAGKKPVKVEKDIIRLVKFSKEMYQLTGGATNAAMGEVLKLWHTYRSEGIDHEEKAALPTKEELEACRDHMDWSKVVLDEEASTVYLADEKMSLDVGSIGKGYGVELVKKYAKELGFDALLLNVGGNVVAIGQKQDESKWTIGIQNPDLDSSESYIEAVQVENKSVVTSGDYQRYYVVNGKTYCHIIDPATLMPAENFHSVTVIAKDSGYADALSTGLFVMPLEDGKHLVDELENVQAMWVTYDGEKIYSDGFEQNIKK